MARRMAPQAAEGKSMDRWTIRSASLCAILAILFPVAGVTEAFAAASAPVSHGASGLAVAPPAGYVARVMPADGSPQVIINVRKADQPATECYVAFQALPDFAQASQQNLNAASLAVYAQAIAASYDVSSIERFALDGVSGTKISATSRANPAMPSWVPNLPTMLFVFYTPKGRTVATCYWDKTLPGAPREEFEAVVRATTLPR
jgi:hypothetical protein